MACRGLAEIVVVVTERSAEVCSALGVYAQHTLFQPPMEAVLTQTHQL